MEVIQRTVLLVLLQHLEDMLSGHCRLPFPYLRQKRQYRLPAIRSRGLSRRKYLPPSKRLLWALETWPEDGSRAGRYIARQNIKQSVDGFSTLTAQGLDQSALQYPERAKQSSPHLGVGDIAVESFWQTNSMEMMG